LKSCEDHNIVAYVPIPKTKITKGKRIPEPDYYPDKFTYDPQTDTYRCPQGHRMKQTWKKRKNDGRLIFIYRTEACKSCPVRSLCTTSKDGRSIHRWEHEEVIEHLKERLKDHPELIKKRKEIVEHVFGTLKRVWNYNQFLLKGLDNVVIEGALMSLAYNIRRVLTIIGVENLLDILKTA
jgi:hypothetical protein